MKTKHKILFLMMTLGFSFQTVIKAQNLNYPMVNQQTYSQYLNKDWKGLINLANKSLKQGIDFYYLRTRLGIAYFETKKYGLAIKHFEKAQKMNSDDVIREYLYYSYLYAGKKADAGKMAVNMPFDVKRKLGLENKLQNIGFGYYINPTENYESLIVDDLNSVYNIKGEQKILKSRTNFKLNFQTRNKSGISTINYSFLHSTNILRLEEPADSLGEAEGDVYQHSFAFLKEIALNRKFNLFLGANILAGTAQTLSSQTTTSSWGGFGSGGTTSQTSFLLSSVAYSDWQLLSGLEYKSAFMDFNTNLAFLILGGNSDIQLEISPTFYLFSNLNLYINPSFIQKLDADGGNLFKIKAGFGLFNKVWFEGGYWKGEISYFSSDIGRFVYNNDEIFHSKSFFSLVLPIKNSELYISYESVNSSLLYEYNITLLETQKIYLDYSSTLFYAGIKFNLGK